MRLGCLRIQVTNVDLKRRCFLYSSMLGDSPNANASKSRCPGGWTEELGMPGDGGYLISNVTDCFVCWAAVAPSQNRLTTDSQEQSSGFMTISCE